MCIIPHMFYSTDFQIDVVFVVRCIIECRDLLPTRICFCSVGAKSTVQTARTIFNVDGQVNVLYRVTATIVSSSSHPRNICSVENRAIEIAANYFTVSLQDDLCKIRILRHDLNDVVSLCIGDSSYI